jgi:enoyl-CoA hydratase/carnithine racemase
MPEVRLHIQDAVARVTLSNPDRLNAMTMTMWTQLANAFDTIASDASVRVVVLAGDGDKAFVSGADISEFETQRNSAAQVIAYEVEGDRARDAMLACTRPVIAAIRGVCVGGGLGLAGACDLRYATRSSRFRMPAARLGVGYGLEGTERFVNVLGAARTAELFYTARMFDGVEAERIGFVHKVYAEEEFDAAIEEIVATIADNAPLPILAAKLAIREAQKDVVERDEQAVAKAVKACFDSEDYKEGRRAFMEKRRPTFTGR